VIVAEVVAAYLDNCEERKLSSVASMRNRFGSVQALAVKPKGIAAYRRRRLGTQDGRDLPEVQPADA
jgi:hypothetical protein